MLQVFRKITGASKDKFPDGKEYLLDAENNHEIAQFESVEDILKLCKENGIKADTVEDLTVWHINIEEVD